MENQQNEKGSFNSFQTSVDDTSPCSYQEPGQCYGCREEHGHTSPHINKQSHFPEGSILKLLTAVTDAEENDSELIVNKIDLFITYCNSWHSFFFFFFLPCRNSAQKVT